MNKGDDWKPNKTKKRKWEKKENNNGKKEKKYGFVRMPKENIVVSCHVANFVLDNSAANSQITARNRHLGC